MPYFFLILLTIVLVFISAKPEGFDISRNYVRPDISYNYGLPGTPGKTGPTGKTGSNDSGLDNFFDNEIFTPGNIAVFTIGFVLFIIMVFLIIKLNSMNTTSSS